MSGILVIGAGGHGKVVADILLSQGLAVSGFLDDDPAMLALAPLGLPGLGAVAGWAGHAPDGLAMGIGGNAARQRVVQALGDAARDLWVSAIHTSAAVAASARIGRGVVIAAQAAVNPDAAVGDFAIINTGATVDHDCRLGNYCHIAPGANLAGGVQIGGGTLVGIGAACIPYKSIGAWAVIGAGAAVVSDIPDGVTAVGVPARWAAGQIL